MDYFEDFDIDQRISFGRYTVTQDEIVQFAKRYDPQAFHVDERDSLAVELGGVMASGWHTTAIFMRLAVDAYLAGAAVRAERTLAVGRSRDRRTFASCFVQMLLRW